MEPSSRPWPKRKRWDRASAAWHDSLPVYGEDCPSLAQISAMIPRDDQRDSPDDVHVQPGRAQEAHPDLRVDHAARPPSSSPDNPACVRRPSSPAPAAYGCAVRATAVTNGTSISPAPCAVDIRESPQRQAPETDAHSNPARVAESNQAVGAEREEHAGGDAMHDRAAEARAPRRRRAARRSRRTRRARARAARSRAALRAMRRSCSPSATAKSHPIPGLMP